MDRNLGGREYLVSKLGERGMSRRRAVRVLNFIFREMGLALRRGEYVEFPFGYLYAEKRLSERWRSLHDEPMRPYFIEHTLDEEGERLLDGGKLPAWKPGWSLQPDKGSMVYLLDRLVKRSGKRTAERGKAPSRLVERPRSRYNW